MAPARIGSLPEGVSSTGMAGKCTAGGLAVLLLLLETSAGALPTHAAATNPSKSGTTRATPEASTELRAQKLAENPPCVRFVAEARYRGIGYEHLVHIANGCPRLALCVITTDVNPDAIEARIDAESTATVLTYRGSPASTFVANVRCQLEG